MGFKHKALHKHDFQARALASALEDRLRLRGPMQRLQIAHRREINDDNPCRLPGPFDDLGGTAADKELCAQREKHPGRLTSIRPANVRRVELDIRDAVDGHCVSVQMPGRIRAAAASAQCRLGMTAMPRLPMAACPSSLDSISLDCEVRSSLRSLAATSTRAWDSSHRRIAARATEMVNRCAPRISGSNASSRRNTPWHRVVCAARLLRSRCPYGTWPAVQSTKTPSIKTCSS